MKKPPEYSLVVFPTPTQIAQIASYKQLLKERIKWFNSVDSAAHITIIQFTDDLELALYIDRVRKFCKTSMPQNVTFNSLGEFENAGTLYIAPDENSKLYLDSLITNLHTFLGLPIQKDNVNAHISIGRKIYGERLKAAREFFKNIDIRFQFDCDAIHVRKFNGKQYGDIIEKISFGTS